jgi:two-component system, response regulator YesN
MYKIIIAEDEDIIRKGLVYSIPWVDMGCSVISEVRNGIEGIEKIKENHPDIVIVDINMPVMDGLEMIQQTYEEYGYVAIILSGYSDFKYAQEAIRYGITGYLLKPLNIEELKEAIFHAQKECEVRRTYISKQRGKEEWKQISVLKEYHEDMVQDKIINQMLEFIFQNYQKKIVMQDVVNCLNYSETLLNKKFKKLVGITFIEYLNRYRIQKAMKLLQEGRESIQDVAWKCGIGEYKYFQTVFKKYIGCSPKEYLDEINS